MVTSRRTGRWLMPKGWMMDGKKPWSAAAIEALEEAGAVGFVSPVSIGNYKYKKVLDDGSKLRCTVVVYPMIVDKLKRKWKERGQRQRKWFSPRRAAKTVSEPKLEKMLRRLDADPERVQDLADLLRAS